MAIKSRKVQSSAAPKTQVIQVSPYENPENVMGLMARICSATEAADTDEYWDCVNEAYNKEVKGRSLREYIGDPDSSLANSDFRRDLTDFCRYISWDLTNRSSTEHTRIVVAGGFSSGKSSFLNRITNSSSLLPTGVEPVSVVKTYLYCSNSCRTVGVKGVNQKNVLVTLDTSVLQAIQHANKSNIYLASVLDKLFVEIPSTDLDGLVFIDTPGYNNSNRANQSNGKTDRQTAEEALSEGNVLFWLVDCDRGTTVAQDIEMIKKFEGKKVVIFNKADKKAGECKSIVEQAAKTLFREMPKEDFIDVLAFSTLDNKVYHSLNNLTIADIVRKAKACGNGQSELEADKAALVQLFDDEIEACQSQIDRVRDEYSEAVDRKDKTQKELQAAKSDKETIVKNLKSALINSYDGLSSRCEAFFDSSKFAIDAFRDFFNDINNYRVGKFLSSDTLDDAMRRGSRMYDKAEEKHISTNNAEYSIWSSDQRYKLMKWVKDEEKIIVERYKEWYDSACERCDSLKEGTESELRMINAMTAYKDIILAAVDTGIRKYQQKNKATSTSDVAEQETLNVFDCIAREDYGDFQRCFENGVDVSVCNADGYSPLTLAVSTGNNAMVKFFLDHDAAPAATDRRGYNAFHTAVENQYRDICKMLLDVDPDLMETTTEQGETVTQLAAKQTFAKWIEDEKNKTF